MNEKAPWEVLTPYGAHERLAIVGKRFYNGSNACVRVSGGKNEWFEINVEFFGFL